MNNEEEKIIIEEPEKTEVTNVPNSQPVDEAKTANDGVVSIIDDKPNLSEQKTEIVVDPVTLKTESRQVEEEPKVEQVKVEKQEPLKDGTKWKRVLLFFFFIFMFAFVMGMPYITEYVEKLTKKDGLSDIERRVKALEEQQKKEQEEKNKTTNQEEYKTLTCISITEQLTNYMKDVEQTFEYNSKNEVVKSSIKTTYTFQEMNETYNTLKTECDQNGLKYIDKDGYEPGCSYSATEVVIENTFDLELFKPIQDGTNLIQANATYKANINTIKSELTNQGYSCK